MGLILRLPIRASCACSFAPMRSATCCLPTEAEFLEEIAKEEKIVPSYATRLFRLTLLAPNIVGAILNGNQPAGAHSTKARGRHAVAARLNSRGEPSASPEASAIFSQRIVRLTAHSETAVPPKPENGTRALSEPAFAHQLVSGGPVPAALHGEAAEVSREFTLSK